MATQKRSDSLVWGIILIVLGVIILLGTLRVDIWYYVWRLWPIVFIIWGASKLYYGLKERGEKKPTPPAAL